MKGKKFPSSEEFSPLTNIMSGCYWNRYETSDLRRGNGSLLSSDLANNHKALHNLCIAIIRDKKGQLKTHRQKRGTNQI